ncbi:hypothetical protein J6590_067591 [Homalodisca vitripennis]|nr:hypothetical protein J6590_067591 [Homalodisca vitripennis]
MGVTSVRTIAGLPGDKSQSISAQCRPADMREGVTEFYPLIMTVSEMSCGPAVWEWFYLDRCRCCFFTHYQQHECGSGEVSVWEVSSQLVSQSAL